MADTQRLGRHRQDPAERVRAPARRRWIGLTAIITAVCAGAAITGFVWHGSRNPAQAGSSALKHPDSALPTTPGSYIGLYAPRSDAQVKSFTAATGIKPAVLSYYSGWLEPFRADFAATAAEDGAVPLVQIDPTDINIAAIAAGTYDAYLKSFAMAIRAYRHPIILSFGHEMNGHWYTWANSHTSPAVFVAAWRHIVTRFRDLGASNVTWLWTINNIEKQAGVPAPGPWWPGNSYVNWVGIDGYYTDSSSVFASVFGPTIVAVRVLTHDPILIAETSATPASGQPAKIANLFAGVRLYDLLGFVWFDSRSTLTDSREPVDWRLISPAATAAFRQSAQKYFRLTS